MIFKFLPVLGLFCAACMFSQNKTFYFDEIQYRKPDRKWSNPVKTENRTVRISADSIDFFLGKLYHLKITKKTQLPDDGAIYLCKDQQQQDVTVTLIDGLKMFVYHATDCFQVTFIQGRFATQRPALAEAEE